jgi:hypothetical protein
VLRYAEVVERHCEQQRVGRDELIGQGRGERLRGTLLVRACLLGCEASENGGRPGRGWDRVDPDATADDGLAGAGVPPLLLNDVGDLPAVGALNPDAGV